MKRKGLVVVGLVAALIVLIVTTVNAAGQAELAKVRKATARFHRIEAAQAAGYDLRPDLDHCFDNPGVGGMGYHYINTDILDLTLNALRPEAVVYTPGRNGQLRLGAVEYIVPAAEWDAAGHTEPPAVLGHHLHLNEKLGVYVLHAWIWRHNPAGVFEDWNPNVSCP
ncbi:MAG: hypothetical protein L0331_23050 [Chloroflexi bacterium]|nr:hypothetical protein [Chloroflexota bacterium]